MFRLSEAIKIKDGIIFNLDLHSERINNSRKNLFGCEDAIDLKNTIIPGSFNETGIYKCRIIYDKIVHEIHYLPYIKRFIQSLKIIKDDSIDYSHKYENKDNFKPLLDQKENCDDILIVKRGNITDTSFSNIVFFDGSKWLTPSQPLLYGTKRQELLKSGAIEESEISLNNIHKFKKASLINAMLDLEETVVEVEKIIP